MISSKYILVVNICFAVQELHIPPLLNGIDPNSSDPSIAPERSISTFDIHSHKMNIKTSLDHYFVPPLS